ncbi:MAG: bifunctional riboflavin kinase/FAD synthetase [Caldicoprobacterales bacterium]|jgi:riboflavin kinase/FMN adenylyltransferase|nr:bifunctional riboflavin kinase/FAD synthetase [Clostridiales bacterium]
MRVIFNYDRNYRTSLPSAIALGTFDGIHTGHRKLMEELIRKKRQYGLQTLVYTFLNHPMQMLAPDKEPPRIMLLDETIRTFADLGIDILVLNKFDEFFQQQSPREFLDQLYENIPVKSMVIGFNFRFGYKGAGDQEFLLRESRLKGFDLVCVPSVEQDGEVVSSTLIRKLIMDGKVEDAARLLEQPYCIRGKVISGCGRGKNLGFPTANLSFSNRKVLPRCGVYLTKVKLKDGFYWGLTNVGTNPTFSQGSLHIETYILDFNENLYEQPMEICFINRLRGEIKYDNPLDLVHQMELDRIKAKKLIYKKP